METKQLTFEDAKRMREAGFAAGGEVWVNDPAFAEAAEGVRTYPGAALARAWFGGSGIGYVLGE